MRKFVVSATLLKDIPTGKNILCYTIGVEAVSEEEAVGKFLKKMHEENPEHSVHIRPVVWDVEADIYLT